MLKFTFFGLLAIATLASTQYNQNQEAECRIYSDLYKQYLFASRKFLGLGSRRSISLWKERHFGIFYASPKTHFNEKDKSGIWLFESIPGRANTYFIRNKKYNDECLRASEKFLEWIFKENRAVYVEKLKNNVDDESFMWRIQRVPNTHLYNIWNVKFNMPLFTREYHYYHYTGTGNNKHVEERRTFSIGLSPQSVDSEQFEWLFRCRDSILPNIKDSLNN